VNRLLIGDGGCIDGSIAIALEFPRVEVFDHSQFLSLGYSLRKLIEAVETEWFVYLHSDVFLPEGWFEAMKQGQDQYDWYECPQHITVMVDYPGDYSASRPYSGSQMGRKAAFDQIVTQVEDDYLYRNEDIIWAALIEQAGFLYGHVFDTFHFHQVMNKRSRWLRKIEGVSLHLALGRDEEVRAAMMQVKGIIKYMQPSRQALARFGVMDNANRLMELGELTWSDFEQWVADTNPGWLPYLSPFWSWRARLKAYLAAPGVYGQGALRDRVQGFLSALYFLLFGWSPRRKIARLFKRQ
jgi:hypothetical protein